MKKDAKKILFVCTGNTCRSAMAAAIFNEIAERKELNVLIESAGIAAEIGEGASENAVRVMSEMGIDLSYHRAKQLTPEFLDTADIVLTMTAAQELMLAGAAGDKVYTVKEYVGETGNISDPYGGDTDVYRETAKELKSLLEKLAEKLNEDT